MSKFLSISSNMVFNYSLGWNLFVVTRHVTGRFFDPREPQGEGSTTLTGIIALRGHTF